MHALSASQYALPPWWSDPFASASAAAVAAAGSSADHAAAYINSLAGRGAVGSSANPGGPSADPDVAAMGGVRLSGRAAGSAASGSSTHGQAVDPDGAHGRHDKPGSDRHDASSALPVNRPFTRHITNASVNNPDSGADAHIQVVRELLAARNRSKADRASDVAAAGGQPAQPAGGESAALVSTAASLVAGSKPDDTASRLPAESAPGSPMQLLRPRDRFMEEHRQQGRRVCRGHFRKQPEGQSPKADRPDTNASAEAIVVAATAKLASITSAVSLTEHHGTLGNLMGSQGGTYNPPSRSQGGTKDDPWGSAAAMPPPAPRQAAETAADAADLLWSPSSCGRDMHSLGAGLLGLPDPGEDRPTRQGVKPRDPSGSETTQSCRQAFQQAKEPLDRLFPVKLNAWGLSSNADKAPSLPGKLS